MEKRKKKLANNNSESISSLGNNVEIKNPVEYVNFATKYDSDIEERKESNYIRNVHKPRLKKF